MPKFFSFFSWILMSIYAMANQNLDSLYLASQQTTIPSEKAELLMKLGFELGYINSDSALKTYDLAERLAIDYGNDKVAGKVCLYRSLTYCYIMQELDQAIEQAEEAIGHYQKANYDTGLVQAHYNMGYYYSSKNDYANALVSYKKTLEFEDKVDFDIMFGKVYTNLSYVYQELGATEQVVENSLKAIELKKKSNDPTYYNSYGNLVIAYMFMNNFEEAKKISYFILENDTLNTVEGSRGPAAINLAKIFGKEGNYDSAFYYNTIGQDFFEKVGYENKIIAGKAQEAQFLIETKQYQKAIDLLSKELDSVKDQATLDGLFTLHEKLAKAYLRSGGKEGLQRSLYHARRSFGYSKQIGSLANLETSSSLLAQSFKLNGQFDSAFFYADYLIMVKDSMEVIQNRKASANMQVLYETQQKENEISKLTEKNIQSEAELEQARSIQQLQLAVLTLVILGLGIVGYSLVQNRKAKREIEKVNGRLVLQNQTISKQNEEKEVLLKEIHHRVKNNLQIISSLLKLQSRNVEDEKTKQAVDEGQNRVKSMALIHQMLYQTENVSAINMAEYIPKLATEIQQSLSTNKEINFDFDIHKDLNVDVDSAIPIGLILTELITNIYKYAFEKSAETNRASIELAKNNNNLVLHVSDNGVGLPEDFDVTKAKSLGLRLIKNLTKQLNGNLALDSQLGTNFTIQIPI